MCAEPLASPDLSCTLAGVRLAGPLVLASGIWGTSPGLLERAAREGASAVTAKTCTPAPRRGHRNPTAVDWGHGLLNAMGLPNPGAREEVALLREARRRLAPLGVALIASISADTADGFAEAAAIVSEASPDLVEVNISCPNVASECGEPFSASAEAAADVTRRVKAATPIPVIVKLAPNVPSIGSIAGAVEAAGADAVCAVNTMPGMLIDAEAGAAVLANRSGGISGPALKPIALRCVSEIAQSVRIPIIGTGGVCTGTDCVEMLMAGACCVGVGSAVAIRGAEALRLILRELSRWLASHGAASLAAVRGAALRPAAPRGAPTSPPPVPSWEGGVPRG
jgi:dihydroorotate dehydrogenase (NAD+) catalytic subunit